MTRFLADAGLYEGENNLITFWYVLLKLHCMVHEDGYGGIYVCVLGTDFVIGVEVTSLRGSLPMTTLICIPPYAPYYGVSNA